MKVKGNNPLAAMQERRLVIFTGKGGVGKTSISAAFALTAARSKKRILLAEVHSSRRIPPLFGIGTDGNGPLELEEKITWMHLAPATALEVYALRLLRFRSVYRAVFGQRAVRRFLRAIPSLAEILVLGHLAFLIEENQYDLLVLDAPSSGPGALMLGAPRAIMQGAPRGPLFDGAAWVWKLLADSKQTVVNLVVTPEELPVSEALDLFHRLRDELDLPLGAAFINRALEDPFPARSAAVLEAVGRHPLGQALAESASMLRSRLKLQETYVDRLRAGIDLAAVLLPEIADPASGRLLVERLAASLQREPRGVE